MKPPRPAAQAPCRTALSSSASAQTTPAPSQAPSTAAAIIEKSVSTSTGMTDMKMNAWATVGSVCPAFSVPGITRSGTILKNLNIAVVVANDPMPSASKKLVTPPITIWSRFGNRASVDGYGSRAPRLRTAITARAQPAINTAVSTPRADINAVIGCINSPGWAGSYYVRTCHVPRRARCACEERRGVGVPQATEPGCGRSRT